MPLPPAQTFSLQFPFTPFFILLSGTCHHSYIAAGSNFLLLRFPFIPSYSYFASLHPENCMHDCMHKEFLRRAQRGGQTTLHITHCHLPSIATIWRYSESLRKVSVIPRCQYHNTQVLRSAAPGAAVLNDIL